MKQRFLQPIRGMFGRLQGHLPDFFLHTLFLVALLCGVSGCEKSLLRQHHDPFLKKNKVDYEHLTTPTCLVPPPPLCPVILPQTTHQERWPASFEKKITVHFSDAIPLKEIFEAVAKQANVSLALDPAFAQRKGIFYQAYQQPIKDMVKNMCALAGICYKIQHGTLILQEDLAFLKTYFISFLTGTRQNQNRISITTDVLSNTTEKGPASDNGSDTLLTSTSVTDFWGELEQALKLMLSHPQETATLEKKKGSASDSSSKSPLNYALHKQAGMLSVYGTQAQHTLVEAYLTQLKRQTSTQIVIEAKIVEVSLSDKNRTGINWSLLGHQAAAFAPMGGSIAPGTPFDEIKPEKNLFTLAFKKGDFSAIAQLMAQFGTTRTLSNPRMTVLNNQAALFKFAKNEVFFRLDVERLIAADGKPDVESTTSQVQTIPIGLVMVVQPSVNLETQEITLTLRPSISKIVATKEDPAVTIKSNNEVTSTIPIVQIREMDSVLKVHSGEVIVMGGFMEEVVEDRAAGLPGLQDIPIFGNLFQAREDQREVTELVIFLKATIVQNETVQNETVQPADYRLYDQFTQDPRPLFK
jgi:MSHA type pilus biogenesis protein MshL